MVKCGYHPNMGIGLKEFGTGLAEAVELKAVFHSRSVSDQLVLEREEFAVVRDVVRKHIGKAKDTDTQARLEAFGALLFLGEYFLNLKNSTRSNDLHSEIDGRIETFISALMKFDDVWKNDHLDKPLVERAEHALAISVENRSMADA